jgi:hypothetical protein
MRFWWSILCLWPGLPQLWFEGRLWALGLAVLFTGQLHLALVTTFVWPELVAPHLEALTWLAVGCVWFACAAKSYRKPPYLRRGEQTAQTDALFREAQTEYLRGNWYQAEALLERVLADDVSDVDARLMLASLYRRVGRTAESREQLRVLGRAGSSQKWEREIQRELEYLNRLESGSGETNGSAADSSGALSRAPGNQPEAA